MNAALLATSPLLTVSSPVSAAPGGDGWFVSVLEALGAPGAGLLVFLENLFPPIPSEVVLPLAGYAAATGHVGLIAVIVWTTLGSVAGAWVLYGLGAKLGRERLLRLVDRMPLLDVAEVERAEDRFRRHGGISVFVGRIVPGVRSLISVPAGLSRMPALPFTLYTLAGSAAWNSVLVYAGYTLGSRWTEVAGYVDVLSYVVGGALLVLVVFWIVRRVRGRGRRGNASDGRK